TDTTYEYDLHGNITGVTDDTEIQYTYDSRNRIITETEIIDGVTYTTNYTYDNANNLTSLRYPDSFTLYYNYDQLNRITDMGYSTTTYASFEYNSVSRLTEITYGNGIITEFSYDSRNRITNIAIGSYLSLNYTYDSVGNIINLNNTSYQYDELNRLIKVHGDTTTEYEYDPLGNRVEKIKSTEGTPEDWMDSSWTKRKKITVTNSSGDTLTDYQIKLKVLFDSDMNTDFSDLRFTDTDGKTLLPYWIEEKTDGNSATVWVKIPEIPSEEKTIYMYYGNPTATSESNGENVFEFFDDFNTLDTDKWQIDTDSYSVSNGILRINKGAISLKNALSFNLNDGYILEGKIKYHETIDAYSGTLSAQSSHYTQGGNKGSDATNLYMRNRGGSGVEILRPDGPGTTTQLSQYPSSGYNYDKVDESTPDDTTYVYYGGWSTHHDIYTLQNHSKGKGVIESVTIYFRCRYERGSSMSLALARSVLRTHGQEYYGTMKGLKVTWATYTQTYTTNPYTGKAWTWSEIDALQAGIDLECNGAKGICTQLYVEVSYNNESNGLKVDRWTGDGSVSGYNQGHTNVFISENDTWYILGEKFYPEGITLTEDRTEVFSKNFTWNKNLKYISLGCFSGSSTYDIQDTSYDWVLIRKYSSTDPSVTIGEEETASETQTIYTYNSMNELTSDGTWSYSYDSNGNLISKTGLDTYEYTYNYNNMLTEVKKNGETIAQYFYTNGKRYRKIENNETTIYIWSGNNIVYEKNLTTGTETKYLYANGFRIAKIVNNNGNETVTYYHQDHLLSTRLLTDQNGNKIEEENYTAFGSDINGISEKYKYTGKEKDITGLYYYGARYYDPVIGRFTTRDPKKGDLMNPQSLNPYVYCVNNPMKYIDPDGNNPRDYIANVDSLYLTWQDMWD
ncbi:hypothetical protein DRN58_09125, partial [Thermococci archaeon]